MTTRRLSFLTAAFAASVAAFAAGDKAINLGASVIKNPASDTTGNSWDTVRFGIYKSEPVKWRVLAAAGGNSTADEPATFSDGVNNVDAGNAMFLLSDDLFPNVYFESDATKNKTVTYQSSDAKEWCKSFESAFSAVELAAILQTTKTDNKYKNPKVKTYYQNISYTFQKVTNVLDRDKIFFLSAAEAENADYGFTNVGLRKMESNGKTVSWWLRSLWKHTTTKNIIVGFIGIYGQITSSGPVNNTSWFARPALNLNLSDVLFTSAADASAEQDFGEVAGYEGGDWKLTLADGNDFSAAANASGSSEIMAGYNAASLTVSHAALSSFSSAGYTDITAMLTDANGDIVAYGSVNNDASATSSTVAMPSGLAGGDYTLVLRAEQWNGAQKTNYASGTPYKMIVTVKELAPTLSISVSNTSVAVGETATFAVTVAGAPAPALQWQVDKGDGQGFVDIAGATASTYTTEPVTQEMDGWEYRCVASNGVGSPAVSPSATLTVEVKSGGVGKVETYRYIYIPAIDGVTTTPAAGYHYVAGHRNFTFTISVDGILRSSSSDMPWKVFAIGYYSGKKVELEPKVLDDGSYQYTIYQITEPCKIAFNSAANAGETGTEAVAETKIWSHGSTLHISAANETDAAVYSITGALIKVLRVPAGEATEALERGVYIVKAENKTAKVVIR